jgi:dCMP deaminase
MREGEPRRDKDQFYLALADTVETGADCLGSQVGAVAVRGDRVLGTGYNGTVSGFRNCTDGGCGRCLRRDAQAFVSGRNYDICLCVHAEQNLMATAARFGVRLEGATLYTTVQPCFQCFKELAQVGFERVVFIQPWKRSQEEFDWVRDNYDELVAHFRGVDPDGHRLQEMSIDDQELASRREARIGQRRHANAARAAELKKTLGIVDP